MRCGVAAFDVGWKILNTDLGLNITPPKKVWKSFPSTPSYPFNRCVCVGNGTRGVQYGNHESASSSSACASFIASQCTQPSPPSAEQGWPRCRVARHARFTLRNWLLTNKSIVRPIWISVPRHSKWKTRLQGLLGHLATISWQIGSHLKVRYFIFVNIFKGAIKLFWLRFILLQIALNTLRGSKPSTKLSWVEKLTPFAQKKYTQRKVEKLPKSHAGDGRGANRKISQNRCMNVFCPSPHCLTALFFFIWVWHCLDLVAEGTSCTMCSYSNSTVGSGPEVCVRHRRHVLLASSRTNSRQDIYKIYSHINKL